MNEWDNSLRGGIFRYFWHNSLKLILNCFKNPNYPQIKLSVILAYNASSSIISCWKQLKKIRSIHVVLYTSDFKGQNEYYQMKNSGGIFENVCEEPICAIGDLRIQQILGAFAMNA